MIGQDPGQQAREYIYKRSILLAQDENFVVHLTHELQNGTPLPKNDTEFEVIVRRFLAGMGSLSAADPGFADKMTRYYVTLGKIKRKSRWRGPLILLLVLALLAGIGIGGITALDDAGTREDVETGVGVVRTVGIVVVVVALFLWTGEMARRFMVLARLLLLIALIAAGVWLLYDYGVVG